ncbi:MAG: hypothetical protein H0T11_07900 [Chthoniobacterales bacterium]|nr:hypothetical protein [Chthoniobacterales bacterium]
MRESEFKAAIDLSRQAFDRVSYNAHYAHQASIAMAWGREPADRVRAMIDKTIVTNPRAAAYLLWKARYELRVAPSAHSARARDSFERALALNPNDAPIRVEFADALADRLQEHDEALQQYSEALRYNDALNHDEGKRLQSDELNRVKRRMAQLKGQALKP